MRNTHDKGEFSRESRNQGLFYEDGGFGSEDNEIYIGGSYLYFT